MNAYPTHRRSRGGLFLLGSLFILLTSLAHAATLTFSTSAPTGGAASISNWTGATFDADNVGGSGVNANGSPNNGSANDGTTYVAGNRPAQGQTFTTGSNADGYTLNAITVRMPGYTNNTASGSNIGGYDLNDTTSTFRIRVGTLSGTTFIPLTQETAASGGSGNPGQSSGTANGPGTYLTFTFKAPIVLAPNTTYAFDLGTSGDYFEWLGIRDGATGGNPYTSGIAYTSGVNGVANGTIATQTGDRVFQVDLTAYTKPAAGIFLHPGLLNTDADFERMRTKVALGTEPWASAYAALTASWIGSQTSWTPRPQTTIVRGATNNTTIVANDIVVAYGSILRWKISGDIAYADQAVAICNAWSSTLTGLDGDTNIALISLNAYQFAIVGEMLRTYPGWASTDFTAFQNMMRNIFYVNANNFLTTHWNTTYSHYWANWDLCTLNAIYAIGVLCDDATLTNQALTYFYSGVGNGCIDRTVNYLHAGSLGQVQETGRDQGHNSLDIALLGPLCEMAWDQGVDLYGYENNRVLAGAEYVAKYNLFYDVPFAPYANSDGWLMTAPSSPSRGIQRPGWDLLYNHYVNRKGLAAPYTKAYADAMRPSGYYNMDQPPFDTLTASLDLIAAGANPSGLTAIVTAQQPVLSWWGSAYATSYNVKRATTSGGSYTTLATGLMTTTYTDTSVVAGTTYYYVVSATTATGETGNSNETSAIIGTSLIARLKFDETSGTSAADATGNGWTGTLVNAPTWASGKIGNAVSLASASSQYLTLPSGVVSDLSDFTIATWVYLNSTSTWARIFDFGSGTERYMYLCPQAGSTGKVRFAITNSGNYGETGIDGDASLPTGQWVHVAVTLNGSTGSLYVNGRLVGQNTNMYFSPLRIGSTTLNYIGKSQWSDPYLNGLVDDFRIYRGALTLADVQTLAATGVAHLKFDETAGTTALDSTRNGWTGTLVNGPTWTTGTLANAVSFDGSNDYVSLPAGVVNGLTTCTLTSWVYLNSVTNWTRVFDFGTGTTNYMFLTPKNGSANKVRFAIRTASVSEQVIDSTSAITAAGWHHIAVTLNGATGTLYIDGAQVGQNTAMTLNPSSLGSTTLNYLGKSQFSADPYLNGKVDDFHIYGTVLTAAQISSLYAGLTNPTVTVTAGDTQNALSWTAVTNATTYLVLRSTTSGGPYTIVASGLTATSYTDTGLTNGVTYYYVVVAQNAFAQSSGSTEKSGYPVPPVPAAPTGLSGIGWNGAVDLGWTAASTATTYNIKRSTTSGGGYTTITTGVTTTTYSDTTAVDGTTYYYVVSGTNLGGEGTNSSEAAVTFTQPKAYLKFDETSGTTAADATGNGWTGTLVNGPTWSTGRSNNTVDMDGSDDYVSLPSGVVNGLTTCTLMAWVNLDATANWARVFDFGTGTTNYMFLTVKNGSPGKMRFAIRTASVSEQIIDGTALPIGGWHHVVVTLNGATGTLYLDGVQAGQNTAMTLTPSSLGNTTLNYLGKSQFSADAYLTGRVDEFRIYGRALSATELTSLIATSPSGLVAAPATLTATAGTTQVALSWGTVSNATSYDVMRATTSGGLYTAVATGLTTASYTDTGLTTGTTYYYVIIARSSTSESPDSPVASATAQ
ncbi:MAG: alginate lyase family protein [Verrucomicrobia bacterium]|nr:alginate lyase family protein [Verrucomicrobiota bacterium]